MLISHIRAITRPLGWIILGEGCIMFFCGFLDYFFAHSVTHSGFFIGGVINSIFALFCIFSSIGAKKSRLGHKEAMALVPLSWIICALFGSLPLAYSYNEINFWGGIFEFISALSTTGISIVPLSSEKQIGALFWHSLLAFTGGTWTVLMHFATLSVSGNNGDSVNDLQDRTVYNSNAQRWIGVRSIVIKIVSSYLVIMTTCAVCYRLCGMKTLIAISTSISTVATSGFVAANDIPMVEHKDALLIVSSIFMALCCLPLVTLFIMLEDGFLKVFKSEQIKWLFCTILFVTGLLFFKTLPSNPSVEQIKRVLIDSTFNTISSISTTGFGIKKSAIGMESIMAMVYALPMIGGCVGSSTGGLKIGRILMMIKSLWVYLGKQIAPKTVLYPMLNGNRAPDETVRGAVMLLSSTVLTLAIGSLFLTLLTNVPIENTFNFTMALVSNSGITNIGMFSHIVGIKRDAFYVSSSILMLLGRLEIFGAICLISRRLWT